MRLFWSVGVVVCVTGCTVGGDGLTGEGAGGQASTEYGTGSTDGCAMVQVLQENCQQCHGVEPIAGAPMSLVTHADLVAPSYSDPSIPVYQMIARKVRATDKPMPPTGSLSDEDLAIVDAFVAGGAPDCAPVTSSTSDPTVNPIAQTGGTSGTTSSSTGSGGSGGTSTTPTTSPTTTSTTVDPDPPPPDAPPPEQCFELVAHGAQTPNDPTPFDVKTGEFYHNFIFQTPYTQSVKGLTFDAIIDNAKVVHHFLLFQLLSGTATDGSHADGIGMHPNSVLITGWAPGGDPPDMPPGVGMELPDPGGYFELEIHYFNNTGANALDRSGMRVCVTSQPLENTASVTWLGTENISIAPASQSTAQGTCTPSNPDGGDIYILQSVPHMHQAGTHMKTVINRFGGAGEALVDEPFNFYDQRSYPTPAVVHPGDTLTTTCTFQNDTANYILFGPSSNAEMCYNFVVSYPAHALAHPGFSLEGSQNTCLW